MIKNVTTGLAQDKNVEGLSKLLELCVQAKLWNHAKYVSLYLPRIQQLRAAGFIAKTQRRNNAQLVGNMEAASTMSIVATTGKLRRGTECYDEGTSKCAKLVADGNGDMAPR